jgi:hypothetical protein
MFCAPFLLLDASYPALPLEMPTLRMWIGHWTRFASKSPFTVFRVPLMNLTHGLLAAVMLSHAPDFGNTERRIAYSNIFSTLLFAIALKSNFEAIELTALAAPEFLGPYRRLLGFGSLTSVVAGVGVALIRGRKVPLPWRELRLPIRDQFVLVGLFAAYVGVVILSLLRSHRA